MARGTSIEILLLDLGGVIIELSGIAQWKAWSGVGEDAEGWRRWLLSPAVRDFESGRSTAVEFADGIVAEFGLAVAPSEFLTEFTRWPTGPYPGAMELLAELRECGHRLAALPPQGLASRLLCTAVAPCAAWPTATLICLSPGTTSPSA